MAKTAKNAAANSVGVPEVENPRPDNAPVELSRYYLIAAVP
jgi:hypothetical protein